MLFNELHIRDFTQEELVQQIRLGNFELTPEVCKTVIQQFQLFLNEFKELESELEDKVERVDLEIVQDELGDAQDTIDALEAELDEKESEVAKLEAQVEKKDETIRRLFGILEDQGINVPTSIKKE